MINIDGIMDICHSCGDYDLCVYVSGFSYCKPCFLRRRSNSKKFRKMCEEIGITSLEDLHEKEN